MFFRNYAVRGHVLFPVVHANASQADSKEYPLSVSAKASIRGSKKLTSNDITRLPLAIRVCPKLEKHPARDVKQPKKWYSDLDGIQQFSQATPSAEPAWIAHYFRQAPRLRPAAFPACVEDRFNTLAIHHGRVLERDILYAQANPHPPHRLFDIALLGIPTNRVYNTRVKII
jgi:hypothetical protein